MRNFLDILDTLLLEAKLSPEELEKFKDAIASRIKELPSDDATMAALREIEDLLKHVNAGGRAGIINGELKSVNDPTVNSARKELARFIMSIPHTVEQREELFTLWRADKLVDRKKLLTPGKKYLSDVIAGYDTNPFIKEFVNEVMKVQALGQGKGEFGLSVLSKSINKPSTGKGDLIIDGHQTEVKTTDVSAGRFADQEVRPAAGYEAVANEINAFADEHGFARTAKSGMSLEQAINALQKMTLDKSLAKDKKEFLGLVDKVITLIFGGKKNSDITAVMKAVEDMNLNKAKQEYAKASFNYYINQKSDEGVLYLDVSKEPIKVVYYQTAEDLTKASMRFHAGVEYISAPNGSHQEQYPKVQVIDTTFGANAAAKERDTAVKREKAMAKAASTVTKRSKRDAADQKDINQIAGVTPHQNTLRPKNVAKMQEARQFGRERR